MISLNDSLLELVEKKVVEPTEAYMKAIDKEGIQVAFKTRGINLDLSAID